LYIIFVILINILQSIKIVNGGFYTREKPPKTHRSFSLLILSGAKLSANAETIHYSGSLSLHLNFFWAGVGLTPIILTLYTASITSKTNEPELGGGFVISEPPNCGL
jgi:hypothetical protein